MSRTSRVSPWLLPVDPAPLTPTQALDTVDVVAQDILDHIGDFPTGVAVNALVRALAALSMQGIAPDQRRTATHFILKSLQVQMALQAAPQGNPHA